MTGNDESFAFSREIGGTDAHGLATLEDKDLSVRKESGYYLVLPPFWGTVAVQNEWDDLYQKMVDNGFSAKVVMEGTGAKGSESYAWAIAHPDKVTAIYARNPVMRSLMSKTPPIDNLAPLAKARVPILHDCGSLDPWLKTQTWVVEKGYRELGGKITVLVTEGEGHFPLSRKDASAASYDLQASRKIERADTMRGRYSICGLMLCCVTFLSSGNAQTDWPSFGNDPGSMRYSPLNQINTGNVNQLKIAWKFDTQVANPAPSAALTPLAPAADDVMQAAPAPGAQPQGARPPGAEGPPGAARPARNPNAARGSESIPLVVDGVLYVSTGYRQVLALNAETGEKIWTYDSPHAPASRGVSYWPGTDGYPPEIVYGTPDGFLVALDAKTGKPAPTFGSGGTVDLKVGVGTEKFPTARVGVSSPVALYKNYVIPGCSPGEGPTFNTACDIRAFDMRTGKLVWTFHTLPQPGEANHEVWKDGQWENRAGLNSWGLSSVDVTRGLIFIPLGTPNIDFYGGDRAGSNLYGSSIIALDANTGKLKWYFQTTHHDNWDYDDCSAPILITVKQHGKSIPAVAQITKQALMFILNRETGKPIYGVKEVPVLNDNPTPGDSNWPTQPMPVKPPPLARDTFSPDEIATVTPEHTQYCKDLLALEGGAMTGGPFAQYGPKLRVIFPSWVGGTNWGGGSYDPKLGYIILDTKDLANFNKLTPNARGGYTRANPDNAPRGMDGYFQDGVKHWPCQQPPWAREIAVNINTGEIAWQVPFGSFEELDKLGVPKTGMNTENGGGISTGGGLTFTGAATDGKFRAFDSRTGKELWVENLNADVNSIPITWQGKNGKQYVAAYAGAGARNGAKPTMLYVFSLP